MVDYEIGCVLFLDSKYFYKKNKKIKILSGDNGIGYTKSKGYFKVENYKNLEKEIIWITNLPNEFFKYNNVSSEYIKPDNFFKIKINSLIYELGLSHLHRQHIAENISKISTNIINILQKNYPINLKENTLSNVLINSFNLNKINFKDYILKNYEYLNKDNFAISQYRKEVEDIQIFLHLPRYNYVRELCKTPFPIGDFTYMGNNNSKVDNLKNIKIFEKISKDIDYRNNFIKKYHSILHVKLTNIDKRINKLLPSNYEKNKIWINNFEYSYLKKYANIHIEELYVTKKNQHLEYLEPTKLFKPKGVELTSISTGIASYNYLNSFLDLDTNSTISTWIKINDKIKMLNIATYFVEDNIKVLSYGNGGLLISIKEEYIFKVIKLANKFGLIYPTFVFSDYY